MSKNNQEKIPKELRNAINLDKSFRESLLNMKSVYQYDFSKRSDISAFERCVHNEFDVGNKRIKKLHNPEGGLKAIERDGVALKKRKQAVINAAPKADEMFASRFPNLCIPDELLRLNSASIGVDLSYCEEMDFVSVAVALWILDRLQEEDKLRKAFVFFPDRELAREKTVTPPMSDTCHGDDVLFGMLYIIQNIDLADDGSGMCPRQRFYEIMKLLDSCVIKRAVRRFEEKQWENFETLLLGIDYHKKRLLKLADEALSSVNLCARIHKEIMDMCNEAIIPTGSSLLSPMVSTCGSIKMDNSFSQYMVKKEKAERLTDAEQFLTASVNHKLDEIEHEEKGMDIVRMLGVYMLGIPDYFKRMPVPKEYGPAIRSLSVDDPYEICFAHLYMREYDVQSVWLYHQSLAVLFAAGRQLPWNVNLDARCQWISSNDELSEDILSDEDEVFTLSEEESEAKLDDIEQRTKLYRQDFTDKGLWIDPDYVAKDKVSKVNIAQIVYALTGVVIPRNLSENLDIADRLQLCGMKKKQRSILEQYILLANAQRMRTQLPIETDIANVSECDAEELRDRLVRSRAENDRLNVLLKEMHAERNAERKRADRAEQLLGQNRTELASLRSMLYDGAKQTEGEKRTVVKFPYTVSCRVVIFGGHEVWLNCIKPLLKGVRYVSPTAKPNTSMLMNTDVIWLQTNVMGHSYYNKIVDTARTHNIPVRYFSFSSAEKCAEQLALDDMNFKNNI